MHADEMKILGQVLVVPQQLDVAGEAFKPSDTSSAY